MYQEVDIKDSRATFILIFCFKLLLEKRTLGNQANKNKMFPFFE
jgi:hypothetical protein